MSTETREQSTTHTKDSPRRVARASFLRLWAQSLAVVVPIIAALGVLILATQPELFEYAGDAFWDGAHPRRCLTEHCTLATAEPGPGWTPAVAQSIVGAMALSAFVCALRSHPRMSASIAAGLSRPLVMAEARRSSRLVACATAMMVAALGVYQCVSHGSWGGTLYLILPSRGSLFTNYYALGNIWAYALVGAVVVHGIGYGFFAMLMRYGARVRTLLALMSVGLLLFIGLELLSPITLSTSEWHYQPLHVETLGSNTVGSIIDYLLAAALVCLLGTWLTGRWRNTAFGPVSYARQWYRRALAACTAATTIVIVIVFLVPGVAFASRPIWFPLSEPTYYTGTCPRGDCTPTEGTNEIVSWPAASIVALVAVLSFAVLVTALMIRRGEAAMVAAGLSPSMLRVTERKAVAHLVARATAVVALLVLLHGIAAGRVDGKLWALDTAITDSGETVRLLVPAGNMWMIVLATPLVLSAAYLTGAAMARARVQSLKGMALLIGLNFAGAFASTYLADLLRAGLGELQHSPLSGSLHALTALMLVAGIVFTLGALPCAKARSRMH